MAASILSPGYESNFMDAEIFPASIPFVLKGLAAAIEQCHPTWRPKGSELAKILLSFPGRDNLIAAGAAYGAARSIQEIYPGPALLLYGTAIDRLFKEEDSDLKLTIQSTEAKLAKANLLSFPDVDDTVQAARERVRMGNVSEKMRREFTRGLIISNQYDEDQARVLAQRIAAVVHSPGQDALIDQYVWADNQPLSDAGQVDLDLLENAGSTSLHMEAPGNPTTRAGKSLFQELVPHAQIACSYILFEQIEQIRGTSEPD